MIQARGCWFASNHGSSVAMHKLAERCCTTRAVKITADIFFPSGVLTCTSTNSVESPIVDTPHLESQHVCSVLCVYVFQRARETSPKRSGWTELNTSNVGFRNRKKGEEKLPKKHTLFFRLHFYFPFDLKERNFKKFPLKWVNQSEGHRHKCGSIDITQGMGREGRGWGLSLWELEMKAIMSLGAGAGRGGVGCGEGEKGKGCEWG